MIGCFHLKENMTVHPSMLHVYIAHKLSAPTDAGRDANIQAASIIAEQLARRLPIVPVCAWTMLARYWPETPELRTRGLEIDKEQISRSDEVWHTGPEVSGGMKIEGEHAIWINTPVYNVIGLTVDEIVEWFWARKDHGFSRPVE